ncbi:MAG: hypothetical protein WC010_00630 [Candidatus Absconditabacterales bacterium]
MTQAEPIDLSIIDSKDLEKLKKRKEKIQRVMEVIKENGLDKDKDFIEEIDQLMGALLEEKD